MYFYNKMTIYIFKKNVVCVYLYIHNKYAPYTNIFCKQKRILVAINRLTALLKNKYILKCIVIIDWPYCSVCVYMFFVKLYGPAIVPV